MFTIEVEYLTGRAVATTRDRREEAEWPPHPARLFSAFVDAAFQGVSADGSTLPDNIRVALEWLERLDYPSLAVSDARLRDVIPAFVPVNDAIAPEVKAGKVPSAGQIADAIAVLPNRRSRQPRFFPTVIPDSPLVHFVWENAQDSELHRPAFDQLAANVTYLGHSSSLVRVAVVDSHEPITYRPDQNGRHTLRVPSRGRLADLISHYRRNARPSPGVYAAYARVTDEKKPAVPTTVPESVFGDVIVCELDGRNRPALGGAIRFLNKVRDAIITRVEQGTDRAIRERVKTLVSGHTPDGGFSREDHVAYIPLTNVGHQYADGTMMGFGLVLPRGLGKFSAERRAILTAAAGLHPIPSADSFLAVTIPTEDIPRSLETRPYIGPSRLWATVTPILCDRFPKDKEGERLEDIIAQSVERIVGTRPVRIWTDKVSRHLGVPPSREFPNRRKPDDQTRHRVHATIEFDHDVRGPLVIGAGRYHGLGLFRTWKSGG